MTDLYVHQGNGLPQSPFILTCSSPTDSSSVAAFMRDHIHQIATENQWQALEIIDQQMHRKGLVQLTAYEINYEAMEAGQTEYFSALIWFDVTQPWTLLEAPNALHH